MNGEPGGARTRDHRIKSAMLYQLSYRPNLIEHTTRVVTNECVHSILSVRDGAPGKQYIPGGATQNADGGQHENVLEWDGVSHDQIERCVVAKGR